MAAMALIDDVSAACERLAPAGWGGLLGAHGLDIGAADLRAELTRELPGIDRDVPGFEDFADEGGRAIEPGKPAESLLYHAFASPNVLTGIGGKPLKAYPTLAEIDAVQSLVFGISPPSLAEVSARFPGALMAVAVFATEYRPAPETVHRRHADVCFSRTGVARVGTAEARYDPARRGFTPFVEDDDHAFAVLPAQYAPYLAVQLSGLHELFGPTRGLPVQLRAATLGADLVVPFEQRPRLSLKIAGSVGAAGIEVVDAASQELLQVGSLKVAIDELRPLEQIVQRCAASTSTRRTWSAARNAAGHVNLLLAAEAPSGARDAGWRACRCRRRSGERRCERGQRRAAPRRAAAPLRALEASLAALSIHAGRLDWRDATTAPAAALGLDDFSFDGRGDRLAARWRRSPSRAQGSLGAGNDQRQAGVLGSGQRRGGDRAR